MPGRDGTFYMAAARHGDRWWIEPDPAAYIVTADSGGWFRVTDRIKELIKYQGYQVAPARRGFPSRPPCSARRGFP